MANYQWREPLPLRSGAELDAQRVPIVVNEELKFFHGYLAASRPRGLCKVEPRQRVPRNGTAQA